MSYGSEGQVMGLSIKVRRLESELGTCHRQHEALKAMTAEAVTLFDAWLSGMGDRDATFLWLEKLAK